MNTNIKLLLATSASALILLAGCSSAAQPAMSGDMTPAMSPSGEMSPSGMMSPSRSAMSPTGMMMSKASYISYDTYAGSMSTYAATKQVLFFYSAADADSAALDRALMTDIDQVPDGVTIVKFDVDAMMKDAEKYGVTHPHTFVVLGSDGKPADTFTATSLDGLAAHLKG